MRTRAARDSALRPLCPSRAVKLHQGFISNHFRNEQHIFLGTRGSAGSSRRCPPACRSAEGALHSAGSLAPICLTHQEANGAIRSPQRHPRRFYPSFASDLCERSINIRLVSAEKLGACNSVGAEGRPGRNHSRSNTLF